MEKCRKICHGLHPVHHLHCLEKPEKKEPTLKQAAFFEKFREEGRQEERENILARIKDFVGLDDHKLYCRAWGEGQPCCLEKETVLNIIINNL